MLLLCELMCAFLNHGRVDGNVRNVELQKKPRYSNPATTELRVRGCIKKRLEGRPKSILISILENGSSNFVQRPQIRLRLRLNIAQTCRNLKWKLIYAGDHYAVTRDIPSVRYRPQSDSVVRDGTSYLLAGQKGRIDGASERVHIGACCS